MLRKNQKRKDLHRAVSKISPERHEFMNMALDAFQSKTAELSTWKTRFIARLLATDVDSKTMARLNRALDPQSRWLSSKSPTRGKGP